LTFTIGVASSVPAGNYPITITGTGPGVTPKTATFNLVVTPAAGGNSTIALSFADCDPTQRPIWLATQSGNGPWTRVNGTNNTFTFTVAGSMGLAYVSQNASNYTTIVRYVTAAELIAVATGPGICAFDEQTGTKRATGTFANFGTLPTAYWTLALGGVFAEGDTVSVPGVGYSLTNIPSGPRDLIAARVGTNAPFTSAQAMIVRRATNYGNNAAIPVLDLGINGPETITPVPVFVTVDNLGTDTSQVNVALVTRQGRSAPYYSAPPSPNNRNRYFALPSDRIQDGDYHLVTLGAAANSKNATSFRIAQLLLRAPADKTISLGPPINPPTITSLGAAAPVRLRAQVASQTAYNSLAEVQYEQPGRWLSVNSTAAYAGDLPAAWTLDIPDLTSAGYDPTWGLQGGKGVDWAVIALGSSNLVSFGGAALVDNAQVLGAGSFGSTAASGLIGSMMRVGRARSIADVLRRVP
jgi:hypothetical protein